MTNRRDRRFGPGASRLAGLTARTLGWLPDQFWQATPAELAAALAPYADPAGQPLDRQEFNRLMERDNA